MSNFKKTIFKIKPLLFVWKKLSWIKLKYYLKKNPRIIADKNYRVVFKKNINWENPKNLIEKIYWLQLYSDTTLWTKCADKYLVRDYVEEKGCGETLNKLYGKWDSVDEINWQTLPKSFVLKTNNSCGQVILVKDKNLINIQEIKQKLNSWLKEKYGFYDLQLHYTRIKPIIIAEQLFENKTDIDKSLIDYKIWCFHGVPEFVLVVYNRSKNGYYLSTYDLNWNNISEKTINKNSVHYSGIEIPKPKSLKKMIETAKVLSNEFPQVRIDFYDIDGVAIFGEMTFTTGYGYFSNDFYDYLGSKIDLNKINRI